MKYIHKIWKIKPGVDDNMQTKSQAVSEEVKNTCRRNSAKYRSVIRYVMCALEVEDVED